MDEEQFTFDDMDTLIVMHRDAHFGGSFDAMLTYYLNDGIGVYDDFEIERLHELADWENKSNQSLSKLLFKEQDQEKVDLAKAAYKRLKADQVKKAKSVGPKLIADLVLSENEDPENEIKAILAQKSEIVPYLLDLIKQEEYYDPLFPGFGKAPLHAMQCLGYLKDKRGIITLFESIGQGNFFDDDKILKTLQIIGDPAKEFLLKVVHGHPFNEDNEKAAIALLAFNEDPVVANTCLSLLKELNPKQHLLLMNYLILVCEGLQDEKGRSEFLQLTENAQLPKNLKQDVATIKKTWKL